MRNRVQDGGTVDLRLTPCQWLRPPVLQPAATRFRRSFASGQPDWDRRYLQLIRASPRGVLSRGKRQQGRSAWYAARRAPIACRVVCPRSAGFVAISAAGAHSAARGEPDEALRTAVGRARHLARLHSLGERSLDATGEFKQPRTGCSHQHPWPARAALDQGERPPIDPGRSGCGALLAD